MQIHYEQSTRNVFPAFDGVMFYLERPFINEFNNDRFYLFNVLDFLNPFSSNINHCHAIEIRFFRELPSFFWRALDFSTKNWFDVFERAYVKNVPCLSHYTWVSVLFENSRRIQWLNISDFESTRRFQCTVWEWNESNWCSSTSNNINLHEDCVSTFELIVMQQDFHALTVKTHTREAFGEFGIFYTGSHV